MQKIVTRFQGRRRPSIPAGLRIYAVGDVHGREDALRDVFARIDADLVARPAHRTVQIFLGDYVDRGPSTRGVLDGLIKRGQDHELLLLKGNHETFFLDFFTNPAVLGVWRQHGGLQALTSYGLKPSLNPGASEQRELAEAFAAAVPASHRRLLAGLATFYKCGDFVFVHAGIRPGVPISEQKEEDLLWIREDFLLYEREHEKIVVHGHTPGREPEVCFNRINLDIGAYATGRLACLTIEGESLAFV
jgi:serine/threonine protein phosphatase 1